MLIGDVWISPPMVDALSKQLGVHRTTVRRWLRIKKLPEATYQLLDLLQNGSIGRIHGAWSDWRINARTGELLTPVGTTIRPGEVLSIPYRMALLGVLQREIKELKQRLAVASDAGVQGTQLRLVPR